MVEHAPINYSDLHLWLDFYWGGGGGGRVMDIKIDEQYKQQTFCKKAFHYARQFTRPILNI